MCTPPFLEKSQQKIDVGVAEIRRLAPPALRRHAHQLPGGERVPGYRPRERTLGSGFSEPRQQPTAKLRALLVCFNLWLLGKNFW
jgi:hypothetical protein